MHSIFIKSKITFGYGVKCTLYYSAKTIFSAIFFLQKIFIIGVGPMPGAAGIGLFRLNFNPCLSYYL
jgi:hypothetical protein